MGLGVPPVRLSRKQAGVRTFPFSLPKHRLSNSRFVAEDFSDEYQTVACVACQRVHLVNPATGKVLGQDEE
jgi:hypothetical protein